MIYDLLALLALLMIGIGSAFAISWPVALIITGALLLLLVINKRSACA